MQGLISQERPHAHPRVYVWKDLVNLWLDLSGAPPSLDFVCEKSESTIAIVWRKTRNCSKLRE